MSYFIQKKKRCDIKCLKNLWVKQKLHFLEVCLKRFFLFSIFVYRSTLSLFLGGNCRFYPSCSEYAYESFQRYKPLYALVLTVKRLLRCRPFGPKGYDPVPKNCGKDRGPIQKLSPRGDLTYVREA